MVRPFIEPSYRRCSLAYISSGSIQLLVGPASSCFLQQMKVRLSTRGHVAGVGPVKITAGEFFLVKLVELSRGASLLPQRFQLLLTAVDPNDLVWLGQLLPAGHPIQHGSIFCQFHVKCPP